MQSDQQNIQRASPDRLSRNLARRQSEWLRGGRTRLLRAANIQRCKAVLEIAAGWGDVALELAERAAEGVVVAVDRALPDSERIDATITENRGRARIEWIQADAAQLPFEDERFDLVFCQCGWLWFAEPELVLHEIVRVLKPEGCVAFIEPDFDGMMEYPAEISTRSIWTEALARAGADPEIGRKLPCWLQHLRLQTDVFFNDRSVPAQIERYDFLWELPLTTSEQQQVAAARNYEQTATTPVVAHLPFWFILGKK